jgi:hypothetical protein
MATTNGEIKMSEILDVVNGISQALSAKQDGGDKFGLEREKEVSMYEKRIMDGFGVSFHGNHITIKYHSEVPLTKVHGKDFKGDIEQLMADIVKHLKEKYRSVKKSGLDLKKVGDCNIVVQTANRRTAYINAAQTYKLGVDEKKDEAVKHFEERSDRYAKQWLNIMRRK